MTGVLLARRTCSRNITYLRSGGGWLNIQMTRIKSLCRWATSSVHAPVRLACPEHVMGKRMERGINGERGRKMACSRPGREYEYGLVIEL